MTAADHVSDFAATTSVQDFQFANVGEPPAGYPIERVDDTYSAVVCAPTFDERRQMFIRHVMRNPGAKSIKSFFYELVRIAEGSGPIHTSLLNAALDYVDQRHDCADFVLAGILRLYYQLIDSPLLNDQFRARAKLTILGFKYWPDEPGIDSMCYWTENHHIIFSANEYLAGQLFPDAVFANSGHTGKEKLARAKPRIEKWLELRFFTGFSEWLSNVYYDEDFVPLLNLVDFSKDQQLGRQSSQIIDLLLYDMALHSYYGLFACTHGRTYTKEKTQPTLESTADTAKLMFGLGRFSNEDNMSAVCFALSKNYKLPLAIFAIATDTEREELEVRQRVSIKIREAHRWGYGGVNLESAMGLLSFGGYCHHLTINHMVLMLDEFGWWNNGFFQEFRPAKKALRIGRYFGLTNAVAWLKRKDLSRNLLDENHIYTYRTPDYMLSTSQAFRPGYGGDQQHIWQATLDGEAVCFTTHPGGRGEDAPNGYWHGNGFMPHAVQHRNVAVIAYNTPNIDSVVMDEVLLFTHAYFPKARFDEVVEQGGWIFGRRNNGYIALHSQNPYRWVESGEYAHQEILVRGRRNIWVVEMGRKEHDGSFLDFIERIAAARPDYRGQSVSYSSPSVGEVKSGWKKGMTVAGRPVQTTGYPRYAAPSCEAAFGADEIHIRHGEHAHVLKY